MTETIKCRMCGDEPSIPCPECYACFSCAHGDCGVCCTRRDFLAREAESKARNSEAAELFAKRAVAALEAGKCLASAPAAVLSRSQAMGEIVHQQIERESARGDFNSETAERFAKRAEVAEQERDGMRALASEWERLRNEAYRQYRKACDERDERAAFAAAETKHANEWSRRAHAAEDAYLRVCQALRGIKPAAATVGWARAVIEAEAVLPPTGEAIAGLPTGYRQAGCICPCHDTPHGPCRCSCAL